MGLKFAKPTVTVDGNVATATLDEKAFIENAPVDEKVLKEVFTYIGDYTKEVTTTAADLAIETFKENKAVDVMNMTSPFGVSKRDSVTTTVKREVTYRNPKDGTEIKSPAITQVVKSSTMKHKDQLKNNVNKIKEALAKA